MDARYLPVADEIGNSADALRERPAGAPGRALRLFALAIAVSVAAACGASSAAESMSTFQDIMSKGTKVGKDVQEYLRRNNPDAAALVISRHLREVDVTIQKVEKDRGIKGSHKVALLKQLRGYRSDLAQSRNGLRAMSDLHGQLPLR
jgi:hypothetical protein